MRPPDQQATRLSTSWDGSGLKAVGEVEQPPKNKQRSFLYKKHDYILTDLHNYII